MKYYNQIDSFRFFAAFAVLVSHWLHSIPAVKNSYIGMIGVDFFFVISGFLISYQLFQLRQAVDRDQVGIGRAYGNFFMRRGLRIFPLYYFVLILVTLFNNNELRDAFLYNLTYTTNFYFINKQGWNPQFSHFWSLSVEEHFYLVWPVLVLLIRQKFIPIVIGILGIGSIAFRYFVFAASPDYFTIQIHTLACLDLFMVGAVLAYVFLHYREATLEFFSKKWVKWVVLAGLGISYFVAVYKGDSIPNYTFNYFRAIFGLFSMGLLGLLLVGFKGIAGRIFENKWLIKGGKISYGIYLLHNFIPGILMEIKKLELHILVEFAIYFVATIIGSLILNWLIEKPFRKIGRRFRIHYDADSPSRAQAPAQSG